MKGKSTILTKAWKTKYVKRTDRQEENIQSEISCVKRGSKRSRENQKERLQYFAAGTAAPQKAGYGAITDRAVGWSTSAPPPCFGLLLER